MAITSRTRCGVEVRRERPVATTHLGMNDSGSPIPGRAGASVLGCSLVSPRVLADFRRIRGNPPAVSNRAATPALSLCVWARSFSTRGPGMGPLPPHAGGSDPWRWGRVVLFDNQTW